jgi:Flp pilus assembly pilin Flp
MSSLIALVIITALSALGTQLGNEFNEVSNALK